MRALLCLFAVLVLALPARAQETPPTSPSPPVVEESSPVLIGGMDGLAARLVYPEAARAARIQGTVFVQFVVNETGVVENPTIERSPNGMLSAEAIRVVMGSQFEPATRQGVPVKVQMTLPIVFSLR